MNGNVMCVNTLQEIIAIWNCCGTPAVPLAEFADGRIRCESSAQNCEMPLPRSSRRPAVGLDQATEAFVNDDLVEIDRYPFFWHIETSWR